MGPRAAAPAPTPQDRPPTSVATSALTVPSACSISLPSRASPRGGGRGSARPPPRLCPEAEDQDTQIHVCDGASSLFHEKGSSVITRAWKAAQSIVQVSEAPRSAGKPANLRQDSAPTHPGIRGSTPPPQLPQPWPAAALLPAPSSGERPPAWHRKPILLRPRALPAALRLSLRPKRWEHESRAPGCSLFFK